MKTYLLSLLLLGTLSFAQSGLAAIPDPFLEGKMQAIESDIGHWQRTAGTLQTLTFLVGALGILVAAMQAATGRWIRATVAFLSVASALILAYNQTFYPADHRSFEGLAKFAKQKVNAFRYEVELFEPLDEAALKAFRKKLGELKNEIEMFEQKTLRNLSSATTLSWPGISSAYAQEQQSAVPAPVWLNNPPKDERNLYFVGVAEGKSVEAARTNALSSARSIALKTIENAARRSERLSAKEEFIADFTQAVASSAEVVNTFVTPNRQSGGFRASTLLRLAKSVAALNAEGFFVDRGVPYDKALLERIESNTSALTAEAQQATQAQRVAVNNGVVYLHIPREEDRPVAEALRQSLSKLISAPGVEKAAAASPPNVVRYFRPEDAVLAAKIEKAAEEFMAQEGYKTELALQDLSGTGLRGAPQQIEIWLGEISKPQPRVYLEIEQGTPRATVEKTKTALEAKGFTVPRVEEITGFRSGESRVFYYKASDAQAADLLVQSLPELGIYTTRDSATKISGPANARAGHFDLRVGKEAFRDTDR